MYYISYLIAYAVVNDFCVIYGTQFELFYVNNQLKNDFFLSKCVFLKAVIFLCMHEH